MRKTNLTVENLEPSDAVHHALQLDPLDVLVLPVHPLHPEDVVAEVQALEPEMLCGKRKTEPESDETYLLCCPRRTIMTAPAQLSPSPKSCSTVNSFSPTVKINMSLIFVSSRN